MSGRGAGGGAGSERGRLVRIGPLSSFPDGRGRTVSVGGELVAVFRSGRRFHAVGDRCPHMGASLGQGRLEDGRVICGWHGWDFDAKSGRCGKKEWATVPVYEVVLRGREVFLRRPGGSEGADQAR